MRAVVFVNGIVSDYAALRRWLQPDDYLICADGGSRHCVQLALRPDVVVGDMDSADPAVLATWQDAGTALERHPTGKNQTDLELALERAIRDGAEDILLLGALGGRLDQTLANLLILAQRAWPARIRLAEGDQVAQILLDGEVMTLTGAVGDIVSVVPLSPEVTGITYVGLEYPLEGAALRLGSTRGISNVIAAHPATIAIDRGILLVVQSA
ncbi:MAG: thiamine diphosphokinase [Caldilineaceae bacterium]|nr:thiamine diphosphokinase [Caldilineaceae bacterium]